MNAVIHDDAPPIAPAAAGDARAEFAAELLHGTGLEIGALHLPMALPADARVRYVDRMTVTDLRAHYPELAALDLAGVDVVDDGERLETIADASVDFIVANHFLEHCEDPIRTIQTHLAKLRPGGILFYAVPDKRFTFDFRRDRTPLQHHIDDHQHGAERSRAEHYLQWASHVHEGTGPPAALQAQAYAHQLEAESYSIHFHVWTQSDLIALMLHIQELLRSFELEAVSRNGIENIVILRKQGELPPVDAESASLPTLTLPQVASVTQLTPGATRDRITLAALRMRLDEGSSHAHWSIDPDGCTGRGLVQTAGSRSSFKIRVSRPLRLEGVVRLLPHDWRDGTRAVRAAIEAVDPTGAVQRLWAGSVASAAAGGDLLGVAVCCEIPAGTVELGLRIDAPAVRDPGSAARAAWMDPMIIDAAAPADGPLAAEMTAVGPHVPAARTGEPLVSMLVPVHDPPLRMLREAVESVRAQSFGDWQLCLVDDGSRRPEVVQALRDYADADARIRLHRREVAGGISDATNAALALASGTFVALLDHDDRITPNALALVAARVAAEPDLDMLYSDEGILQDERIVSQSIKPDWSPESLVSLMYTCHLGIYRRTLVQEIGGLRPRFDGCQDYDLVLRIAERTDRIAHIPAELYQWRAHAASTAGGEQAKPYAYLAQPLALSEHLARRGVSAEVALGALPGMHRLRHRVDPHLEVTIAATVAGTVEEISSAAPSWVQQSHPHVHVVLSTSASEHTAVERALAEAGIAADRVRVIEAADDGDPAVGLAAAAVAAIGDGAKHLVLMEQPAAGVSVEWLSALVGHSAQPGVAAAGAVVLSQDGRVADAGLALPEGIALPLTHGIEASGVRSVTMNTSAAAGVLAVSAATLAELGGLNSGWGPLMLAELCVRAGEHGLRTVVVPDSRMQLTSIDRTVNDLSGLWRLRRRWLTANAGDPFYSPRYRTDRGDFEARVRL